MKNTLRSIITIAALSVVCRGAIIKTECSGVSMLPTMPEHSVAIVDNAFPMDSLKIGDIIWFFSLQYRRNVVHRVTIIWRDKNGHVTKMVTKGDGNSAADKGYTTKFGYQGKVLSWSKL